jgi:hypothetical protein
VPQEAKVAFDSDLAGVVLVSQAAPGNAGYITTWTWTGSTWKQLNPSTSPTRRFDFGLAQVANTGLVLVGGDVTAGPDGQRNDVWLFRDRGWMRNNQATSPIAGPCAVAYDAARQVLLLFSFGTNETWTWDRSNWVRIQPVHEPAARLWFAAMGYDAIHKQVVLFGGKTDSASGSPPLNQTWVWTGSDWQNR